MFSYPFIRIAEVIACMIELEKQIWMVCKARFHVSQNWEEKTKTYVTRTWYARAPTAQTKRLHHRTKKEKQLCCYKFLEEGKCCRGKTVLLRGLSDAHSCFRVQVCIPHRFIHFQGRSRTQVTLGSKEEGKEGQNQPAKKTTTKRYVLRILTRTIYSVWVVHHFFHFLVMSPVAALKPFRPVFLARSYELLLLRFW